jgi:hypothetical protein
MRHRTAVKTGRTAAMQAQALTRSSFGDYVAMAERLAASGKRASAVRFRAWPAGRPARHI